MRGRKMLGQALAQNAAHGGVELPDDLASGAKTYLAELEKQIARIVITVAPATASVLVDGRPLEPASGGVRPVVWAGTRDPGAAEQAPAATFELDVDPGSHVFIVSADGFSQSASTHSFEPGAEGNLALRLAPVPGAPGGRDAQASSRGGAPMYLALGVGAVGLVAGTALGILAITFKGEGEGHQGDAGTVADWSTVSFIVGGVGVGTAGVLWLTAPKSASTTGSAGSPALVAEDRGVLRGVRLAPWLAPWGGGVTGTF
jgi:hypothetical protein